MEIDRKIKSQGHLPIPVPFFYGWVVVALSFLATLNSAGIRSALPVFINPLEAEFGWSRLSISWAGGISLLLFGVGAPLTGWLLDRFGPRRVMLVGLTLLGAGVESERSLQFMAYNRNKRSIVLDLEKTEDRDTLLQFVANADFLLESAPGSDLAR
ncbi:MAG: MFS transporter, partial [Deltaproteobacteria bacterium]|nr:MFS transporter [Deltaproteobacteria bacterium]